MSVHPKVLWPQVIGWGVVLVVGFFEQAYGWHISATLATAAANVLYGIVGYQVTTPDPASVLSQPRGLGGHGEPP